VDRDHSRISPADPAPRDSEELVATTGTSLRESQDVAAPTLTLVLRLGHAREKAFAGMPQATENEANFVARFFVMGSGGLADG
jgi:hypothetical protein